MTSKVLVVTAVLALAAASSVRAQQPVNAASLYAKSCATCHGPKGTPSTSMSRSMGVPDFSNPRTLASLPDSVLVNTVTNGKGRLMASFKGRLKPEEIVALVAYVRTLSRH
jgi:mono/diheme cytochrome c family protein